MTKIKNTKKGMAKKTLSMSLVVAMLATSNVPVWAADAFSDGTDITTFSSEEAPDVDDTNDDITENAQDLAPQQPTISVNEATNGKISVEAARNMTVDTNWQVSSNSQACINVFVPQPGKTASVKVGDKNEAVKANFDEAYSAIQNIAGTPLKDTHVNWKQNSGKVINPADYIGKTIYVAVTEAQNNGAWEVKAVTQVTITTSSAQDYVKTQFTANKAWGTVLTGASYVSGCELANGVTVKANTYKWVSASTEQPDGYTTVNSDAGKKYSLTATLVKDNKEETGVVLGTVTITSKTATIKSVTWEDGVKTDNNGNPTYTYDGTEHNPKLKSVTLTDGITLTVANETYKTKKNGSLAELTADDKTNANTGIDYIVTFDTADYGTLSVEKQLKIDKYDLKNATLTVSKGFDYDKTGVYTVAKPDDLEKAGISVKDKAGKDLELGDLQASATTGYSVSVVAANNSVGSNAYVTVTAGNTNANYKGSVSLMAPINKCKLKADDVEITNANNIVYDGNAKEPTVSVKGGILVKDVDYTVSYSNNVQAGKATVTVTGKGNYEGTVTKEFEIKAASLDGLYSAVLTDLQKTYAYTGKEITPVKVTYNGMQYQQGRDFNVEYIPQNINAGKVRVKLTGIGNYKDAKLTKEQEDNLYFTIQPRSLKDNDVKVELKGLTYSKDLTDAQIEDAVTVTYNGMTLVKKTDYNITVNKTGLNTTGKVEVTLTGISGNYKDERKETLAVTAKNISEVTLPKIEAQKYSGYDFTVSNDGSKLQTSNGTKSVDVADFVLMDGTNKLVLGTDYKIAGYENNKNVGTATINIVGINGYTGKASISFPIVAKELNGTIMYKPTTGNVTPLLPDQEYSYTKANSSKGYTFDFASSASLETEKLSVVDETGAVVDPKNYTVTYKDNKAAGTATITIEGKGGYKLNAVNTFRIVPAKLSSKVTEFKAKTAPYGAYYYTGEAVEPELTITAKDGSDYTLVKDVDYKVEYSDNVNAGTAKVKLVGLGNYAGTLTTEAEKNKVSETFEIKETTIRDTDISASDVAYAGGITVTPNITIKNRYSNKELVAGTDYTVEVSKNGVNVGQAEATIKLTAAAAKNYDLINTGKTEYTVKFNVTALDLSKATISPIADQAVTGEQIKPAVTVMNGSVKLTEGKDYEVSYGANKEIGEGTVTIKALSSNKNYTGSQTVKFNIVKDAPVVGKTMISDVKVVGNKATVILSGEADGASGYDYVISTDKDCTTSKDYDAISKNQVKTSTAFKYVQKGTYYAYCHAWTRDKNGKKVFGEWSEGYEFKVKATTPAAPVITEVKVKGSTITVTYNKVSNVAGYDVVLGTSSKNDNGELRPYRYGDHKILNINKNKVTVQFKNVPKKNWVVGMRSFTKDPDTNKKVFSRWSNLMPAKVK